MTDRSAQRGAEFRIGSVISKGVSTYFRNFFTFLILSIVAFLPAIVIGIVFGAMLMNMERAVTSEQEISTGAIIGIVLLVLAFVLGWLWMSASITYGVIASLRQGGINLGQAIATSFRAVVPLLGLGAIVTLLFAAMALLIFIPVAGIFLVLGLGGYLMVRWWVAIPALVVESIGPIRALSRAAELTKGCRWAVLGVIVLWGLVAGITGVAISAVLSLALGLPMGMEETAAVDLGTGGIVLQVVSGIVDIIFGGLGASVVAVGYHDLRIAKEGGDTEQIAQAFD